MRVMFAWYDLWVGVYVDRAKRRVYVCPLPCVVFVFGARVPTMSTVVWEESGCRFWYGKIGDCKAIVMTRGSPAKPYYYHAIDSTGLLDHSGYARTESQAKRLAEAVMRELAEEVRNG